MAQRLSRMSPKIFIFWFAGNLGAKIAKQTVILSAGGCVLLFAVGDKNDHASSASAPPAAAETRICSGAPEIQNAEKSVSKHNVNLAHPQYGKNLMLKSEFAMQANRSNSGSLARRVSRVEAPRDRQSPSAPPHDRCRHSRCSRRRSF